MLSLFVCVWACWIYSYIYWVTLLVLVLSYLLDNIFGFFYRGVVLYDGKIDLYSVCVVTTELLSDLVPLEIVEFSYCLSYSMSIEVGGCPSMVGNQLMNNYEITISCLNNCKYVSDFLTFQRIPLFWDIASPRVNTLVNHWLPGTRIFSEGLEMMRKLIKKW